MKGRYWKTTVVLPPAIYLLAFRVRHFILSNSLWMDSKTHSKCCWTKEEELNHCWWFWLLHKLSMRIIRLMWDRRDYEQFTMSKIVRRLNRCKMIIHIRQLNHQPSWSRRSFFPRGALSPLSPSSSNLYPLILSSRPGSSISKISNGDWYYSELWDNDQFGGQLDRSLAA